MNPGREEAVLTVELLVLVVVTGLLVGSAIGQPIGLAFVETGSMAPTMEPGDGFVAIPPSLVGEIETGDVVTFHAEYIQGGGLTTHRVVERDENHLITAGDANAFTDQQVGERPLREEEVLAVALQINGDLVVIPHLGTVREAIHGGFESIQYSLAGILGSRTFLGIRGVALLLFLVSLVAYALEVHASGKMTRSRDRRTSRRRGIPVVLIIGVVATAAALAATGAMIIPAGPQVVPFDVVDDTSRSGGLPVGSERPVEFTISNPGLVPMTTILEGGSQYTSVDNHPVVVPARGEVNTTITIAAPDEPGRYRGFVIQHRYLGILPAAVILILYNVHPWLPIVGIDLTIFVAITLLGRLLLGTGRIRIRSRERHSRSTSGGPF